jgi:hypothetical protein
MRCDEDRTLALYFSAAGSGGVDRITILTIGDRDFSVPFVAQSNPRLPYDARAKPVPEALINALKEGESVQIRNSGLGGAPTITLKGSRDEISRVERYCGRNP